MSDNEDRLNFIENSDSSRKKRFENERERERDRDRERNREPEIDRDRNRDRERERERDRGRDRERDRGRDIDRERERERERERDRNRERERIRERERARDQLNEEDPHETREKFNAEREKSYPEREKRLAEMFEEKKPKIPSTVTTLKPFAVVGEKPTPSVELDDRLKQRNRKMFGFLVNTLQDFKKTITNKSEQHIKREEVEKQIEAKVNEEKERLHEQHQRTIKEEREAKFRLKEEARKREREKQAKELEEFVQRQSTFLQNFLRTKAEPSIYYLPVKHNTITAEKLAQDVVTTIEPGTNVHVAIRIVSFTDELKTANIEAENENKKFAKRKEPKIDSKPSSIISVVTTAKSASLAI
eukprot:TRINITY_DN3190_c1_g1_i1.p1 TRINITY_DN3190_c1_g1~~TRINITY_DN3190_c1_g1_i1.p1  ORF type:complete len:359 (+),score=175.61 TRINITY_DN3190_c1_g1_i1:121-1197(+)